MFDRVWIQLCINCFHKTISYLSDGNVNWAVLWVLICMVHLTACYHHVTYEFQSESTLYSYCHLNFRYGICFEDFLDIQANYRVWIYSETHTWHDNNIQLFPICLLNLINIFHYISVLCRVKSIWPYVQHIYLITKMIIVSPKHVFQ